MLHLRFPIPAYTADQVRGAIRALTNVQVKEISSLEVGFFEVHCFDIEGAKKIRGLNGKCLEGNPAPIIVITKEHSLCVYEIFDVLRDKVEIKQRVADTNALKVQVVRQLKPVGASQPSRREDSPSSSENSHRPPTRNSRPATPTTPATRPVQQPPQTIDPRPTPQQRPGEGYGSGLTRPPPYYESGRDPNRQYRGNWWDNQPRNYWNPTWYPPGPPVNNNAGKGKGKGWTPQPQGWNSQPQGWNSQPQGWNQQAQGWNQQPQRGPPVQGKGNDQGKGKGSQPYYTPDNQKGGRGKGKGKGKGDGRGFGKGNNPSPPHTGGTGGATGSNVATSSNASPQ